MKSTGIKNKLLQILILSISLTVLFSVAGCAQDKESGDADYNQKEWLTTEDVIAILESGGYTCEKSDDNISELGLILADGQTMNPVAKLDLTDKNGYETALLVYVQPHYITFDSFTQKPENEAAFADYPINLYDFAFAGKNIELLPLIESETDLTAEEIKRTTTEALQNFETIKQIFFEKAFCGQDLLYTGESDNWEVVMETEYFNLEQEDAQADENDNKSVYVNAKVYFKYKSGDIKDAKVIAIKINDKGEKCETAVQPDTILTFKASENKSGYYVCEEFPKLSDTFFEYDEIYFSIIDEAQGSEKVICKQQ